MAINITRLPASLACIRSIVMTDGTVIDNATVECDAPILSGAEISAAVGFDLDAWKADYRTRLNKKMEDKRND